MSGGIAYVWDPRGRFRSLCNPAMVELEPVEPVDRAGDRAGDRAAADDPDRPRQRSVGVEDSGMGDPLRFDAERLRILVERHHGHTGSPRAAGLLAEWPVAVGDFRLVRPKDEVGRIEAEAEGTERTEAEEGVTIP
jgi:glutamate synthase (NADPH/NADH) large chain